MNLHTICGLPRSGSTLLSNVLQQNPRFSVWHTSPIPVSVNALSGAFVTPEEKSEVIRSENAKDDLAESVRAYIQKRYELKFGEKTPVGFDKSRTWNSAVSRSAWLYPDSHVFVLVRDLRDVFASVRKRHKAAAPFDAVPELTQLAHANDLFSPEGVVGVCLEAVANMLKERSARVHFIPFEKFIAKPEVTLFEIYSLIGEEPFDHDFDNVENSASDVDGMYFHRFPHEGSGKVEPPRGQWSEHVSPDIADALLKQFPQFNARFGYQ